MLLHAGCLISLHIDCAPRCLAIETGICDNKKLTFFMKFRSALFLTLPVVAVTLAVAPRPVQAKSDTEQICISVGRLMEEGHYTRQPLNDEMSRKFLKTYLELL